MLHAVLLGDSIFDNALYVPRGEPVIEHLRNRLGRGNRATLLAVDGAVIASVGRQLEKVPPDATHLVLSVGGNDALEQGGILNEDFASGHAAFSQLSEVQSNFSRAYRGMLCDVRSLRRPVTVCTIYDSVPGLEPEAVTALSVFNDAILRAAIEFGLSVIDLRMICNYARDYSEMSPIEPSDVGGAKIATAISRMLQGHNFSMGETVVYR